jgi:hypothetical protein
MLALLGCFFAHLSYSLRTARLDSSLFMLATQTLAGHRRVFRDFAKHNHAELAMLGWAKPLFSRDGSEAKPEGLGANFGGPAVMSAIGGKADIART